VRRGPQVLKGPPSLSLLRQRYPRSTARNSPFLCSLLYRFPGLQVVSPRANISGFTYRCFHRLPSAASRLASFGLFERGEPLVRCSFSPATTDTSGSSVSVGARSMGLRLDSILLRPPKICAMPGSCLNPKTHLLIESPGNGAAAAAYANSDCSSPTGFALHNSGPLPSFLSAGSGPNWAIDQPGQSAAGNLVLDRRPCPRGARCPSKPSRPSNLHPTESCCPRTAYGRCFERSVRCVEFVGQLTAPDVLARSCLLLINRSDPRERAMEPIRLVDCSVSTAPFLCYTFASALTTGQSCTWRIPVSEVS
jgi:hypothetical protein